jgi:hypothetical protein
VYVSTIARQVKRKAVNTPRKIAPPTKRNKEQECYRESSVNRRWLGFACRFVVIESSIKGAIANQSKWCALRAIGRAHRQIVGAAVGPYIEFSIAFPPGFVTLPACSGAFYAICGASCGRTADRVFGTRISDSGVIFCKLCGLNLTRRKKGASPLGGFFPVFQVQEEARQIAAMMVKTSSITSSDVSTYLRPG